ncbi:MAG: hypothetical protein GWO41_18100 [candidate division Zixibacteria bacterium]|nr:hypothetical protein [candidate division Zixibacteria bacterium]NIR66570.1 hypothetical protein [candidate division Zixibacteria bacterium]NIS48135.1 hypothetical protein [candidate division Zixibacteria bacterium]NIT54605.1 hypothetical protein [candidate division Zixibacteria bacterium]NIU16257.1 hypothetical protein [candidate division Zixibacteria bacterium]
MTNRKLAILIPLILDLGVLLIIPLVIDQLGLLRGILVSVAALVAPWVPFTIISLAINNEISKEKQDWEEKQKRDYV